MKKPNVTIIGAGMAGLLAANLLRRYSPKVLEMQTCLPHNHSALLRFRSSAISDATSIPFKRVLVRKGIWDGERVVTKCDLRLANVYSQNVAGGGVFDRSIWKMDAEERYVAPNDFVEQMAQGVDIQFSTPFSLTDHGTGSPDNIVISTLPMPVLWTMLQRHPARGLLSVSAEPSWTAETIYTMNADLSSLFMCNIHQTLYNASEEAKQLWYRATIHGSFLTIEAKSAEMHQRAKEGLMVVLTAFGINPDIWLQKIPPFLSANARYAVQQLGKITPMDEVVRRQIITKLSDQLHIYSLGRFATWRPGLLMDDLIKDIRVIEQLINHGSSYSGKLYRAQ